MKDLPALCAYLLVAIATAIAWPPSACAAITFNVTVGPNDSSFEFGNGDFQLAVNGESDSVSPGVFTFFTEETIAVPNMDDDASVMADFDFTLTLIDDVGGTFDFTFEVAFEGSIESTVDNSQTTPTLLYEYDIGNLESLSSNDPNIDDLLPGVTYAKSNNGIRLILSAFARKDQKPGFVDTRFALGTVESEWTFNLQRVDESAAANLPEPATLSIWGVLIGIAGAMQYARRRRGASRISI